MKRSRGIEDVVLAAPDDYAHRTRFNFETNCVSNHFLRHLGHYAGHDCIDKVIVEAGNLNVRPRQLDISIMSVSVQFSFDSVWQLKPAARKRRYLLAIVEGMSQVAADRRWNVKPIQAAQHAVERESYANFYSVLSCKSRTGLMASAWILFEVDRIEVSIVVNDKNGTERARKLVATVKAHEFFLVDLLGELRWVDTEVVLVGRSGECVGGVAIEEGEGVR